jgi:predicted porin
MWLFLSTDVAGATSGPAQAAETSPASVPIGRKLAEHIDVYGRFDGNLGFSKDGVDFANNGSRFGTTAELTLGGDLAVFGQGEWSVNLGQGDTRYNLSENPDTGLGTFESTKDQAIGTRLGFFGVRFGDYGTLTLGKQWAVYYDVSAWTDVFTVFGATGSSTFNAGTDGGQTGEGRANDAVAYRVKLGRLHVGMQTQFLDTRSPTVDSLSGSLVYDFANGLQIGAAYSHAFIDFDQEIVGYDGKDAQALSGGISFHDGRWTIATLGTWTRNHELVATEPATVMYDTLGAELFVARKFDHALMPYAGFDLAIPRSLDTRFIDPDYGTRDLLGGVRWLFDEKGMSYAYIEARTGQTRDSTGARALDLVMIGIRLNYSLRRALGLGS